MSESGLRQRPGDQPLPIRSEHPVIQDLVIDDIRERRALGEARYGTPLQPFNGRNTLLDAYEEALDLAMYLRQAMYEAANGRQAGGSSPAPSVPADTRTSPVPPAVAIGAFYADLRRDLADPKADADFERHAELIGRVDEARTIARALARHVCAGPATALALEGIPAEPPPAWLTAEADAGEHAGGADPGGDLSGHAESGSGPGRILVADWFPPAEGRPSADRFRTWFTAWRRWYGNRDDPQAARFDSLLLRLAFDALPGFTDPTVGDLRALLGYLHTLEADAVDTNADGESPQERTAAPETEA